MTEHEIALPAGTYRFDLLGGGGAGAADGSPGEPGEPVSTTLTFEIETRLRISVGAGGSQDAPPGHTSVVNLDTGETLVIAPPLPPRWEPAE